MDTFLVQICACLAWPMALVAGQAKMFVQENALSSSVRKCVICLKQTTIKVFATYCTKLSKRSNLKKLKEAQRFVWSNLSLLKKATARK